MGGNRSFMSQWSLYDADNTPTDGAPDAPAVQPHGSPTDRPLDPSVAPDIDPLGSKAPGVSHSSACVADSEGGSTAIVRSSLQQSGDMSYMQCCLLYTSPSPRD